MLTETVVFLFGGGLCFDGTVKVTEGADMLYEHASVEEVTRSF